MHVSKSVVKSVLSTFQESILTLDKEQSMRRALETLSNEFGRGVHRPVCVKCNLEMRPERNGVGLLVMASFGPYRLYDSDKHKCPECGVEIVAGLGANAISEHFKENFERLVQSYRDEAEVVCVKEGV